MRIWAGLRHPAICGYMGTCICGGLPCIVLEFLDTSLHHLLHKPIKSGGSSSIGARPGSAGKSKQKLAILSERTLAQISREVATGVAYLHARQLIHRDIKAANVLLDRNLHAKVADFGISTRFTSEAEHTAETGTYRYMAPEVIRHQQYDHRCDVYSYGLLLWEVLHREIPFRSHSPLQAAYAVAMQHERPPLRLRKELAHFESVIVACWDAVPQRRPPMTEVADMLTACEAKLPEKPTEDGSFLKSLVSRRFSRGDSAATGKVVV